MKTFYNFITIDVITSKKKLTTIDLIVINNNKIINNKTLTSDEFAKDFRFNIIITKICLTKNLYNKIAIKSFYYLIN